MKKSDVLKKFLPVLCILITVVTIVSIFAACSNEKDTPYGSLTDDVYMSIDKNGINFSVSEKELYDAMKYNGYDLLKESLEKQIFASQIETVKNGVQANDEDIMQELKDIINKACYGTDEEDDIADMKDKEKKTSIKKFYDNLFAAGVDVKIVGTGAYNEADLYSEIILEHYYLELAKKLYAKEKLKEDIKDEESDYYIDVDDEYPTYFDSNIKNTDDVSVLIVQFSSESESENVLKDLHLKFISGKLYYIPIGTKTKSEYNTYYDGYDVISENATALTSIQTLIEFVRIYNYVYSYREPITITYNGNVTTDLVSVSTSNDSALTEMTSVSDYYLDTYSTATDASKKLSEEIIAFADTTTNQDAFNKIKVTFEREELEKFDATATNYIYSTLSLDGYTDPSEIFFTPKPQSGASKSYIAYKLAEGFTLDWDELKDEVVNEDDENGKYHTYYNESYAKIEEEMFDEKLTASYIDEVVNKLYTDDLFENKKIEIYDPLLETIYKVHNDGYKKNNEKSKDAVASVEIDGSKRYVYVDDFYKDLERVYGLNTAYNLAGDLILNNLYLDQIDDEKIKELTDDFEALLAGFSAGNMSSSGYDPKIGKDAFLKTYLKVSSSQEAINRIYIRQEEEKLFYEDYDLQAKLFGFGAYNNEFGALNTDRNKDDLFKALAALAKLEYDEYFSISYRNILVYTDFDNDGNPDDPSDYDFNPLSKTETDESGRAGKEFVIQTSAGVYESFSFVELANNLIQKVITEAKKSNTVSSGLDSISAYYTQANKYNVLDAADIYYSNDKIQATTDTLWGEYRRLGLELKIEANTSSTNDAILTLDEDFYNNLNNFYIKYLKNDEKNTTGWTNTFFGIIDATNIQKDADDRIIINDDFKTTGSNNLIATQFGYHVIYVTDGSLGESAEFDSDIDDEGFRGEKIYPADINNNTEKYLNEKQIGGYLEDDSDNKEKIAPQVKTAINAYFSSLNEKYTNSSFQSYYTHLLINSYYDCSFSSISSASNVLDGQIQIIKNAINGYHDDINAYDQWWAMFN